MRRAWISGPAAPLIGVALGVLAAIAITLLQDESYRSDASIVLVRQGQPPGSDPALAAAAESAAELFDTRAAAASAIGNLGLDDSPDELLERVDVESETGSSLVRIEVEAAGAEEARRTAQELAEVSTVLFNDRFGPTTVASVWEPASAHDDAVSPDPARNLALGALLGALAGWVPLLLPRRRPAGPRVVRPPRREAPAAAEPVPTPIAAPVEPTTVAPPLEPAREPAGPFVLPDTGEWTVADVERLVREHGAEFPERAEEIGFYVESFHDVAAPDGRLPVGVESVLEDVFGPLIARARVTGRER
ncbi:MAG: hypothetical protein ACRDNB_11035 [Gaiellaceae bacterium]